MSRDIAEISAHVSRAEIHVFFAVELMFDTTTTIWNGEEVAVAPLYFWTGLGDLTIGAITYTGTGNMLGISEVKETADISAAGATLSLTGIPTDILSLALQVPYQGRLCRIKFGMFDANRNTLLLESGDDLLLENGSVIATSSTLDTATPALTTLFVGYMDQMNIDEGPETSTVTLAVESKLIDLERPRIIRYTSASQKSRHAGDLAFDFIPDLQDRPLGWGRSI
jgi:hypothetical protein